MKVLDIIREKSDQLTKQPAEFFDRLNPQVRSYLSDAMHSAKNSHWFNWSADAKNNDANLDDSVMNDQHWQHETGSPVHAAYQRLSEHLNQTTYVSDWVEINQERINLFASVTEDEQWIHTDPERAKTESPYRSTVAHGFLTLSLIPRLMSSVGDSDVLRTSNAKMIINVGLNQVRYLYPVKAGSNVRGSKKVISVQQVKRGLEVTEQVTIEIEGIRRPACVAETVSLLVF
ncbi:MaoC family dehydratase [Reinekea thalattae]|uniref:MaoC family dehydratase n=1 Tax=Reinekea thalattae TaxID=2593301 RepID=A0A5C8Z8R6_9GAMM|nr:MaoC family dehydratase [Reinekea thalattae]TXR53744.1 MaoC family dehydratase [Reinekea thalattae]